MSKKSAEAMNPNPITERIIKLTKETGVTQSQLASAVGKSFSTINNWFRYPYMSITADFIYPVAQALGVTCEYLLSGKEPKHPAPVQNLDEFQKEMLKLYNSLDIQGKARLINVGYEERLRMQKDSSQENATA